LRQQTWWKCAGADLGSCEGAAVGGEGRYIKAITLSSTMGPGIPIDLGVAEVSA
jgi:hypothetical protein